MIVVTGGAGFIGSALTAELNARGLSDILLVDQVDHPEKEKNLAPLAFRELRSKEQFLQDVLTRSLRGVDVLFHLGACSSTTETDEAYLRKNNFEYTRDLAGYALENDVRFIYASSAATYGDGSLGYADDESRLETLRPLNSYGNSKQMFDLWAHRQNILHRIVGLKYFNVYGPNEYHKEEMQSLVRKGFFQIRETGKVRLFKSYKPEYPDGGQVRDFIYIKDAVAMTLFFADHPGLGGIFNVGAGTARSWNELAQALFTAQGRDTHIEYIEMPESIRPQYQYHTCAEMDKIRRAGYTAPCLSLEAGVADYVQNYLLPGKYLGE
ncbi:MAG: ADP-glyceromanno-heptose 6-epimerase [Nitrospinales bacterium]